MENIKPINHLQIVNRDWRKVLVVALIVVLLALLLSLVRPFLYRATVSILVLQKSSISLDAYSASKSEERIANKLSQVVYSSSFLEKLFNAGFDIDKAYFQKDEAKKRKQWNKTIEADVPTGLSNLRISIYHTDPNQALQISRAVAYVLTSEKREYIGIEDVDLKIIDAPLVSTYPVKPNILLNVSFGLIFGLILGVAFVILFYNPEHDKLFSIPRATSLQPKLVNTDNVPEKDSVEEDMAEIKKVPEIKELEQVEELAIAEEIEDKPSESEVELPEEHFQTPDLTDELNQSESASIAREDVDENEEELKEQEINIPTNRPKFEDEERIIGMPEKK